MLACGGERVHAAIVSAWHLSVMAAATGEASGDAAVPSVTWRIFKREKPPLA